MAHRNGSNGSTIYRPTLGAAVIGCGYWGMNYVRVLNDLPTVRLVAACDAREDRLADIEYRHPGTALSTDVDSVLERDDVDMVVISIQAAAHYEVALRALEAGMHVLVEKPLTTTVEDGERLIEMAESRDLTLMVGHTFLYHPGIAKVADYVAAGASGQILYLYAQRTNLGPIRADVNALWDLAPHDVSVFNFLLGQEPEWVSAVGARPLGTALEDVGFVTLGYPGGVLGHIHVSWADPHKTRELVVVCEEKRVVFNDLDPLERVRVFEKGVARRRALGTNGQSDHVFALREGRIVSPPVEAGEPLKRQCEHFVACVAGGSRPLSDGYAGVAVVRAMEAIDRSLEASGAPTAVEMRGIAPQGVQNLASSVR